MDKVPQNPLLQVGDRVALKHADFFRIMLIDSIEDGRATCIHLDAAGAEQRTDYALAILYKPTIRREMGDGKIYWWATLWTDDPSGAVDEFIFRQTGADDTPPVPRPDPTIVDSGGTGEPLIIMSDGSSMPNPNYLPPDPWKRLDDAKPETL